jgi:hypothetical protein
MLDQLERPADIELDADLLGVLACLVDLSSAAYKTKQHLDLDNSPVLKRHRAVLKTYGDEFMTLSEKFRVKLIRFGEDIAWSEDHLGYFRRTNQFEVDDLDSKTLLAALSAYTQQQQRFLESVQTWNIVGTRIVDRALMLASSMNSWALTAESAPVAS